MVEKRGRGEETPPQLGDPSTSDPQNTRARIRKRWEFASVLNFFHVFQPLFGNELKISADEIETALITPNDVSAKLHVALLKGIPPVAKNMMDADVWVTIVSKKLAIWWPWVAEGDNPLVIDHGKEIQKYKELDPITRMLVLKALCEVRAEQDDVLRYITDELKKGTKVSAFRKERIGSDGNGVNYWYDGDPVIGHRLYKEIVHSESKQKPKEKGRAAQLPNDHQWETLATELEEFREISENLLSSKISAEAVVGGIIKNDVIPVLEELQKKKEKALKRQQRKALELNNLLNYSRPAVTRTCRERGRVNYTFDDYDRCIEEAIEISKKQKTTESRRQSVKKINQASQQPDASNPSKKVDQEDLETDEADVHPVDNKYNHESDDTEDDDFDENDEDQGESNDEEEGDDEDDDDDRDNDDFDDPPRQTRNQKNVKSRATAGVRRSQRLEPENGAAAGMKKRLRQRPTHNSAECTNGIDSDTEEDSSENEKQQTEALSDSEMEASASCDHDGSQSGSGDASE